MKAYFFACLLSGIIGSGIGVAYGQAPANDDPCGAVPLVHQGQLCTAPTTGTNQNATYTTPNGFTNPGSCGTTGAPLDVWYKFTTTASGLGSTGATITVAGNPAGQLRLFAAPACAGPFTEIACSAAAASNTTAPALTTTALTPNTTYYVRVAGYRASDSTGPFTICVTNGPGAPPICLGPTLSAPVYTAGNTAATLTFAPLSTNAGPYTATLLSGLGATVIPLFTVTPPTVAVTGLVPGNTYELHVSGICPAGGQFISSQRFLVPPPNDEPCQAQALPLDPGTGCTPTDGATRGSRTTIPNGYTNPGCGGAPQPSDVWYTFTTTASGPGSASAVLTVSNAEAAGQLRLFAASSCNGPFAALACTTGAVASDGAVPLLANGLVPNTTYYISVAPAQFRAPGFFTICVSATLPALPCPTPSLQMNNAFLTATSAAVSFTLPNGSIRPTTYTVTYAPLSGGPAVTIIVVDVPIFGLPAITNGTLLTGLQPSTTYTVTVQSNCSSGTQSTAATTTFTTLPANTPPPLVNNDCSGAISLPVRTTCVPLQTTNFNALVATLTNANPSCGYLRGADVWYSMVVPANGIVEVTTGAVSGSVVRDTGLSLYAGSCGSLTEVVCNDGVATNGFARVRATGLVPGSTVYAQVWRNGSTIGGDFTICATTDVTCPVVTGLTATSITQTAATITFTLPAGGTGYTLTYTPTGGTARTQVVTASPVLLTGLLPNTTYTISLTGTCSSALPATVSTAFTTLAIPACTAPGAVYVGNLTATSAGVGFTAGPAGTSYVLSYQAAGGTPQTLAPAASPAILTGLVPGTQYTVCLVNSCANGVSSAPTCATAFSTLLAVRNLTLADQLGLFPNPAHRSATLTVPTSLLRTVGLLTLTDALGRTMRQRFVTPAPGRSSETRTEVDLAGLPSGIYLLRLLSSEGPLTKRLVIE